MKLESTIAKVGTHSSQEVFVASKDKLQIGSTIRFKFSKQKYDKFYEGRIYNIGPDGMHFIELI